MKELNLNNEEQEFYKRCSCKTISGFSLPSEVIKKNEKYFCSNCMNESKLNKWKESNEVTMKIQTYYIGMMEDLIIEIETNKKTWKISLEKDKDKIKLIDEMEEEEEENIKFDKKEIKQLIIKRLQTEGLKSGKRLSGDILKEMGYKPFEEIMIK